MLLPIGNALNDMCETHEARIQKHCIARLRRDQPQPAYVIGDVAFEHAVRRLALPIQHGPMPGTGARTPLVDYAFGTTTARIFAGGPFMPDGHVEVIEL